MLIRLAILLPLLVAALSGCQPTGSPNMAPVGEGLRFLGVALVVAVLLASLGFSRKGGGPHG